MLTLMLDIVFSASPTTDGKNNNIFPISEGQGYELNIQKYYNDGVYEKTMNYFVLVRFERLKMSETAIEMTSHYLCLTDLSMF